MIRAKEIDVYVSCDCFLACVVGQKANGISVPVGPTYSGTSLDKIDLFVEEVLSLFDQPFKIVESDEAASVMEEILSFFGCKTWNDLGKITNYYTLLLSEEEIVFEPWVWDGIGFESRGDEHSIRMQKNLASEVLKLVFRNITTDDSRLNS